MASTGWKEWRKKDVTADAPGETQEQQEPASRRASRDSSMPDTDRQLNRALRGGSDAVFVARLDANNDLRFELANESARVMLGIGNRRRLRRVRGELPGVGAADPPEHAPRGRPVARRRARR